MDSEKSRLTPDKLPSPEELFRIDGIPQKVDVEEEPEPLSEKKPIPRYKKVRFFSAGFVIFLLALALLLTNLDRFHVQCYCMRSDSMGDELPAGSVIFTYKVPVKELNVGDVITYTNGQDMSVTHKIVNVIEDYEGSGYPAFRTKGTENVITDSEVVTREMINGKVIIHIPYIGKVLEKVL